MKPILFSTAMVQAILEGRKTQTRRVIKPKPDDGGLWNDDEFPRSINSELTGWNGTVDETGESKEFKPKYQKGDILWVRETFSVEGNTTRNYSFKADLPEWMDAKGIAKWKPSIFMPKAAARIFLKVISVRAERLHDVTWNDAMAEGIQVKYDKDNPEQPLYKFYPCNDLRDNTYLENPVASFCSLWKSINGLESWDSNPWVWVYEFERIDKSQINQQKH